MQGVDRAGECRAVDGAGGLGQGRLGAAEDLLQDGGRGVGVSDVFVKAAFGGNRFAGETDLEVGEALEAEVLTEPDHGRDGGAGPIGEIGDGEVNDFPRVTEDQLADLATAGSEGRQAGA